MQDLFPFSQANPASANYVPGFGVSELEHDPCSAEHVDLPRQNDSVKSVVFSQVRVPRRYLFHVHAESRFAVDQTPGSCGRWLR